MSPTRMERLESAIRIILQFNEAFNHHDVAGMLQRISSDCIVEDSVPAPDGKRHAGREALAQYWQGFLSASPNTHNEIEEIFSLGEHCVMCWKSSWTDAAGKQAYLRGVDVFRVRNGLISEKILLRQGMNHGCISENS